jgi:RNA polymerase primary sigma factor
MKNEQKSTNLAKSISQFFNETKWTPLTKEEEFRLIRAAQAGDKESRDIVIKSQLRYVIQYVRKYQGMGLSLEDLIQHGSIGICEAIDSFDIEKGFRFNTFAQWKILGEISNALSNEGRTIRIPHSKKDRTQFIKSISEPVNGNEETFGDLYLKSEDTPSKSENEDLHIELGEALKKLKPRHTEAICRFFGVGYEYAQPMEQIGEEMGIGTEGARYLVKGAESALRKIDGIDELRNYL